MTSVSAVGSKALFTDAWFEVCVHVCVHVLMHVLTNIRTHPYVPPSHQLTPYTRTTPHHTQHTHQLGPHFTRLAHVSDVEQSMAADGKDGKGTTLWETEEQALR